ncbi:hypothetical protein NIES4075_64880 [Tolypothrix sp. NIES-4075]|nr:hypothetical protein NIES4075_64880 [Tolypothrix sp. NIES-4075]
MVLIILIFCFDFNCNLSVLQVEVRNLGYKLLANIYQLLPMPEKDHQLSFSAYPSLNLKGDRLITTTRQTTRSELTH